MEQLNFSLDGSNEEASKLLEEMIKQLETKESEARWQSACFLFAREEKLWPKKNTKLY